MDEDRLRAIEQRANAGEYRGREHFAQFDADEDVLFLLATIALLRKKAHDWNAEADRYLAQRDELLVALKAMTDDLKARWDMRDPRTNPGIRHHVEQAESVLAKMPQ